LSRSPARSLAVEKTKRPGSFRKPGLGKEVGGGAAKRRPPPVGLAEMRKGLRAGPANSLAHTSSKTPSQSTRYFLRAPAHPSCVCRLSVCC